jgi:hypothetical protein
MDGCINGYMDIWMRWIDEIWKMNMKMKMKDEYQYEYKFEFAYKSEYQ